MSFLLWGNVEVYCVFGDIAAIAMFVSFLRRGVKGLKESRDQIFGFLKTDGYYVRVFYLVYNSQPIIWWNAFMWLACLFCIIILCYSFYHIMHQIHPPSHQTHNSTSQRLFGTTGFFPKKYYDRRLFLHYVIAQTRSCFWQYYASTKTRACLWG